MLDVSTSDTENAENSFPKRARENAVEWWCGG